LHDFSPVLNFNLSAISRACKFAHLVLPHGRTFAESARFLPILAPKPGYASITDRKFALPQFYLQRPINPLPPIFPPRMTQRKNFNAAMRNRRRCRYFLC
jgi:hypothetical protein